MSVQELAINGGPKLREKAWPARGLIGEEEKQAVVELFDNAIKTGGAPGYGGPKEDEYCEKFAEFMGGGYADAVNSGTTAVFVALKALDLEPFSEVIVGAVTDPGGMMPIPMLGCIPIVADTAPGSFNTSVDQIEPLITERTSAIVVAHISGEPADIEPIAALAKKHNIYLVEDCAQAHGAKINGKMVGTFGDIGCFSTMFGKHHCTGGQGGVVYTKDEDIYWKIRRASDRGKPFNLDSGASNPVASLNFNLSDFGGAIGVAQLEKLPAIVESRRKSALALKDGLKNSTKAIRIAEEKDGFEGCYWFTLLRVDFSMLNCDKKEFCDAVAAENGMPMNPDYSVALPHTKDWFINKRVYGSTGFPWNNPEYKGDKDQQFPTPNALKACADLINIYINEAFTEEDIADAIEVFKKVEAAYLK
ncbi:MAG: DegT/DnrJ/EryC1/StrS family aminotransferase [Planctomycetota bacterium]|jgi:dTDP-4-amino-4,6-dideoxygalactose transaminase